MTSFREGSGSVRPHGEDRSRTVHRTHLVWCRQTPGRGLGTSPHGSEEEGTHVSSRHWMPQGVYPNLSAETWCVVRSVSRRDQLILQPNTNDCLSVVTSPTHRRPPRPTIRSAAPTGSRQSSISAQVSLRRRQKAAMALGTPLAIAPRSVAHTRPPSSRFVFVSRSGHSSLTAQRSWPRLKLSKIAQRHEQSRLESLLMRL